MTTKSQNGHKNYNAWNVSLWINNDQGLYNMAKNYIEDYGNRDVAAKQMTEALFCDGMFETPDGVKFTKTNIRLAMVGM